MSVHEKVKCHRKATTLAKPFLGGIYVVYPCIYRM